MSLDRQFATAQSRVQEIRTRPNNPDLLELYALFKQATEGDVEGKPPPLIHLKERAKFNAWASKRSLDSETARRQYVELVDRLLR